MYMGTSHILHKKTFKYLNTLRVISEKKSCKINGDVL